MSISFSIDLFGAKKPVEGQFLLSGKAVRPPASSIQKTPWQEHVEKFVTTSTRVCSSNFCVKASVCVDNY